MRELFMCLQPRASVAEKMRGAQSLLELGGGGVLLRNLPVPLQHDVRTHKLVKTKVLIYVSRWGV